jgi:hypothetical protein
MVEHDRDTVVPADDLHASMPPATVGVGTVLQQNWVGYAVGLDVTPEVAACLSEFARVQLVVGLHGGEWAMLSFFLGDRPAAEELHWVSVGVDGQSVTVERLVLRLDLARAHEHGQLVELRGCAVAH